LIANLLVILMSVFAQVIHMNVISEVILKKVIAENHSAEHYCAYWRFTEWHFALCNNILHCDECHYAQQDSAKYFSC
jgi:hypothetical protein